MKNIELDDLTYQRLSVFAEMEKVSIPEAINFLVDVQQIPAVKPGPGYAEWLRQMIQIGDREGEEAALKWRAEHPYEETLKEGK